MPNGLTPKEYTKYLQKLSSSIGYQMRWAANQFAFLGKIRETKYLKNKLTLRNNWMRKGVRVEEAKSIKNPISYVYHIYEGLTKQQEGGKHSARSGKNIAIPREIRKNDQRAIGKARRPAAMLDKDNVFKTDKGIFQQLKTKLKVLYLLRPSINLKKRIDFAKPVYQAVKNNSKRVMQQAIDYAVKNLKF